MKIFKSVSMLCGILIVLTGINAVGIETEKEITPTDVFYLAKSIDDSLMRKYELTSTLTKKRISNNIRTRNVYEKMVTVAAEYNFLHNNVIDSVKLADAANVESNKTKPADVYAVLSLISKHLMDTGAFTETTESRSGKTPSDVFQMMRQISMHHHEIARKKNIQTDWATPKQVCDAIVMELFPVITGIADELQLSYEAYPFPKQPVSGIIPRYPYKLLAEVYANISGFYTNKMRYDPVILEYVTECDDISPADGFDLAQIIAAEFKAVSGGKILKPETEQKYRRWKEEKEKIVPGDTFRLVQYCFIMSKKIAAGAN